MMAPVVIRAQHHALRDFGGNTRPGASAPHQLTYPGVLRPDMMEIEHRHIRLTAIRTRMTSQVLRHLLPDGLHTLTADSRVASSPAADHLIVRKHRQNPLY